jgi:hypothetical protein
MMHKRAPARFCFANSPRLRLKSINETYADYKASKDRWKAYCMSQDKFPMLRNILRMIGLSSESIDEVVEWIADLLANKNAKTAAQLQYPYFVRDDFISRAEHKFFLSLKLVIGDKAIICPKVSLGDIFGVKENDASKFRTLTNKIDRKHVDFLVCHPQTVKPLFGVELDDKSHQRPDRQERDLFVNQVFAAASLPLVRIPVRATYSTSELSSLLQQHLPEAAPVKQVIEPIAEKQPGSTVVQANPQTTMLTCSKCGSNMILRTSKSGTNQGEQFWGCSNFPKCRAVQKIEK